MSGKQPIIQVFIDSQNLNLGVKTDVMKNGKILYYGWTLDYKKFFFYLKNKYKASKCNLFIGKVPENNGLYTYLSNIGYQLIFRPTLQFINSEKTPQIKGNVDSELVLHTMIEYDKYDQAIIVAGDGDYFCLIEYLAQNGKLAHILIPNKYQYSSLLRPFSEYMIFVSDLKNSLERK